ncbi:hypothetical protein [Streptomyces sp. G-G2]|uniref:hypothetical protein n=1 Tax=Streptomyces sp. G-G2 TaxID=3046201 RepID=UPI0024BB79F8|nr:hypothetical protein [Streptomyces sp. G-G2]MDJ0382407.1 hypothetical protein [Streptomyces sp. G-G2]
MSHELIRCTARHGDQLATCLTELATCLTELATAYVTAVDDNGELKSAPAVPEQARAKVNPVMAKMARPPKQRTRPLAQLRVWWQASAILNFVVELVGSLLERARTAAAAMRARVAKTVDIAWAAVNVTEIVFMMTAAASSAVGTCSPKRAATSPSSCAAASALNSTG